MNQMILNEKYPVFVLDILKTETSYTNVVDILKFFKEKIENHPVAKYIGEFDHFEHTKAIDGEINAEIQDCQIIIFCFGSKLPNGKITAARPRNISVTEYKDKFEISFLEAPALIANEVMEGWIKDLQNHLND